MSSEYAIVTPARDEVTNLPRLAAALGAQTLPPARWILVDDGSEDGTLELARSLTATLPFLRVVTRADVRAGALADGRREGRDLISFLVGVDALDAPVDVVVKVDADVDFEPEYFATLIGRLAADPSIAIASGTCYESEGGTWVRRTKSAGTVWGASRAYRWDALDDLRALEPKMGWDGLDELRVQLRGARTETFVDLPFRHHRPEGGREHTGLHQGVALGRASWYMGYRPTYLVLRAAYRAVRQPSALAMLWGYAAAAVRRAPRCPDREVVAALRSRQRLRHTLGRGAPAS